MGLFDGYKVIDMATLFAGPMAATLLGDHGADVIKVEHPRGDDVRRWGGAKDGKSLWWKVISRNKRCIAIDLNTAAGQQAIRDLARDADVLVENYRPGRMEAWGLGWDELHKLNPRLVMLRMTGFGQKGPYSSFAGFGTLAEAMSGFADITGQPDGPPTLPPFGLADGIAGIAAAFAVAGALVKREKTGKGEMVDVALYEPLMWILGSGLVEFDQLGQIQKRAGNQSGRSSPRNTYPTKDDKWIALSASADSIARRVFAAIGRADLVENPDYATNRERIRRRDEIDAMITAWTMQHTQEEALKVFRDAEAAVAPIYDISQVAADPHFRERGSVVTVQDPELGPFTMQGVFPRVPGDPATIRWTAAEAVGSHTDEVLGEIGYDAAKLATLRQDKVIG
jgi:crotonobetainyl-CoA:carnitine CoA-transferase CaiB-like acyl-CoA transferase